MHHFSKRSSPHEDNRECPYLLRRPDTTDLRQECATVKVMFLEDVFVVEGMQRGARLAAASMSGRF